MKNLKKCKLSLITLVVLCIMLYSGCEKNTRESNTTILGTWISSDLIDTVDFRTEKDFYKTVGIPEDHFNYRISTDSITIQYYGFLKILVQPTIHYFHLSGNSLTIDLRNCYGFRNQIISFTRE